MRVSQNNELKDTKPKAKEEQQSHCGFFTTVWMTPFILHVVIWLVIIRTISLQKIFTLRYCYCHLSEHIKSSRQHHSKTFGMVWPDKTSVWESWAGTGGRWFSLNPLLSPLGELGWMSFNVMRDVQFINLIIKTLSVKLFFLCFLFSGFHIVLALV